MASRPSVVSNTSRLRSNSRPSSSRRARRFARARAGAVRQVAGDQADREKREQRHPVLGIGNRPGADRRQEEVVEGEHGRDRRHRRHPESRGGRDHQHDQQEGQRDRRGVRHLPAIASRSRWWRRPPARPAASRASAFGGRHQVWGIQPLQHRTDACRPGEFAVRGAFVLGVVQVDALDEAGPDQRRLQQPRIVQAPAALRRCPCRPTAAAAAWCASAGRS